MRAPIHLTLMIATAIGTMLTTFAPQAAEARPSTQSFSCYGVKNFVRRNGAVVMNTKSPSIFRRFVANKSYCYLREGTKLYSVPTKTGWCRLYACYEYDNFYD